jgi:3-dehydroquinate dehydratase-1
MSKSLQIGSAQAKARRPLIAVPLLVEDATMFQEQITQFNQCQADVIEWRIDAWHFFADLIKLMPQLLGQFNKPVLVTYRTQDEGGLTAFDQNLYRQLNQLAITNGASAIDIEVAHLGVMHDLRTLAYQNQVTVIGSKHCLGPAQADVQNILAELVKLPVDVVKFAEDVQTSTETDALLTATRAISLGTDKPLITMGMGAAGQRSRTIGYQYGSQLTFASLTKASAAGQLSLSDLCKALNMNEK